MVITVIAAISSVRKEEKFIILWEASAKYYENVFDRSTKHHLHILQPHSQATSEAKQAAAI